MTKQNDKQDKMMVLRKSKMCKCSDYKNKLFSVLGDSVSTLEGYSVPESAVYYDTKESANRSAVDEP